MRNAIIVAIIVVFAVILTVLGQANPQMPTKELSCINSGGTMKTMMCCASVGDFPKTCFIGACGCSLQNSHEIKICECQEGMCFDGNECVMQD